MGLEAGIWASGLRYGPGDWGEGGAEEEEEKIPHMCESIGRQPLRAAAQKMESLEVRGKETDRQTYRQTKSELIKQTDRQTKSELIVDTYRKKIHLIQKVSFLG